MTCGCARRGGYQPPSLSFVQKCLGLRSVPPSFVSERDLKILDDPIDEQWRLRLLEQEEQNKKTLKAMREVNVHR